MIEKRYEIEYEVNGQIYKTETTGYFPICASGEIFNEIHKKEEKRPIWQIASVKSFREMDATPDIDEMTPSSEEAAKGEVDG